jgi:hypothetical protein
MRRHRFIALAIIGALVATFFAYGPFAPAAERRHATPAVHPRQTDINDIAGLGAWRGCAATPRPGDSPQLIHLYCARRPTGAG